MGLAEYADDGLFAPRKIADAFRTMLISTEN